MSYPFEPEPFAARLRVMRIVHGALCLGVVIFAVVVVLARMDVVPLGGAAQLLPPAVPLVSYIGVAFAGIIFAVFLILPGILESAWRKQVGRPGSDGGAPDQWWALYQTRLIMRSALLEGAAFFQLIAYLIEGQPWSLGVGLGLLVVLLTQFPTRGGVEWWVESQRDLARQGGWQ
jgi:hypothetical protein